jgi:16S rRNA (cytidine1402-2'-O)-methyltransferase
MPGTLYVVATPIGNLEDVTLRALRVLREVTLIAAEDTRRTARLLQHYSISTPTTSLHEHNEHRKSRVLIERLIGGESIALVTDAGTPVVSDPGGSVVAAAHAANIKVEPIPGPSAAMAALSASGLSADQFVFLGFPPSRSADRKKWLRAVAEESRPLILFEAPHRLKGMLADALAILGDREVAMGRELTKAHEELVVRQISELLDANQEPRGEYTLVIAPAQAADAVADTPAASRLIAEFGDMTNSGAFAPKAAVKELARRYAMPSRMVYATVHKHRESGE